MITIRSINGEVLTHFDNDVPNGNPYFEPVMTDDMESLVSSFSFSVPLQLADTEYLTGMNQVLTYDRQGDLRLFIITDVYEDWNTTNGVVKVDCEDVSITEMNNIVVNPFEAKDFNEALTKTFKNSGWKFKFAANWKEVIHDTFILEDYTNMRDVLAQLKDTYECQFKFMAQENEYGEITRVVEVFKSVGNNNGKYFYYNRDLLGIERDISFTDVKTAIHPYYVGYNGKVYTLANFAPAHPDPDFSKDKESPLIVNKAAHAEYDDGNSYRIMPYKTEVQGDPELVYREAIEELKKHAEPIYTYTVNALLLQNMIEWEGEDIDLGDTVWMKERVGNRELGLEARVVAYEYHEDDPSADKVTFSNFKEIDTRDVEELSNRIFFAYANSADGHLDFSTDDSVGKAYMGVYTSTVTQQSTDPDTYKWTRIKGEDGNSAPTLSLTTSQQVMKFRPDGTPDGDQSILFTAVKQNSTEAVEWEAIPYRGEAEQPAITLEGTGDTRTLSSANWDRTWTRVQVTVTMGALKDIQTVVQVADGATGASGKAIVGFVTNESTTFAASTAGTVSDYTQGNGKFVIYEGTTEVTSGVLYAKESNVGINLVIDASTGEYTVANMTQDQAQAVVKATYKGVTITKFLSFAKSKQGAKGDKGDTGRDGIAGKDGVGLRSTAVTYAASTSGTTSPATGWQEQVPTVAPDNFLWTRTIWTYSDGTSETGYSVAKMGRDGAKGDDGIAGKDGVGIADTLIEYAVGTSGTTRPTSGWSTTIPTTPQGQYLWTRTTWTYTDSTTEQGFTVARQGEKGDKGDRGNDGIAGKDGVGLRSTSVTYAKHTTASTPPSTGWQEQVPTVPAGQYLWTKTVWTYTDNTSETGYSVARMGQDGAKGDDGIAGKDGVGIKNTVIEYAVSTSGTVRPTSNWSTAIPNTPAGQYLWTRTTWTYTDNTTEQGFTVARQGEKGDKGDQGIAGPKGADGRTQYTHIAYADNASGGGFSQNPTGKAYIGMYVDFEELDSSDPTRYAWSLIKGADGEQGVAGPKGEDGRTPYFHTAYTNSTDFGTYDYSGNPNLMRVIKASDFKSDSDDVVSDVGYNSIRVTSQGVNRLGLFTLNKIPSLVNGKTYTIRAKIKFEEGSTGDINKLRVSYRQANSGAILINARSDGAEVGKEIIIKGTATVNYVITDVTKFYLTIDTDAGAKINGSVIVSDIKIEEGSTATPYQPNLLDAPWHFSTVPLGDNIADPTVKFPIKTSAYRLYGVNMLEDFKIGQRYTLTMKATKPASQTFIAYNGENISLERMTPVEGLTDVWSCSFTILKIDSGSPRLLSIYQSPRSTVGACQIDWLKIEKGNARTPNIDDYKYLGNYTDFVQADSSNPTKYSWSQIKGDAGETQYTHIAYANSSDGVDGFTTVYPNLNLLDGTKDFSGTWNNSSHWVTDGTYKGLSVKKRTSQWNGIYKTFTAPKDGIYTFSAYIKSSGNSANVYRYGGINSTLSQGAIQQKIGNNFDWTRDSVTLNLKANDDAWIRYEITGTGADSILWTAGHKYELSSTSTPYMPSDSEVITADWPSYIGQYTDLTQANSTNPSDYTWSLIRGNDGETSHVHTAYAWSSDGTDRFTKDYPNENLFVKSRAERTGSREFVNSPNWDMAPIIDKYGVDREYSVSFDLKSKVAGGINVYSQNGSGTRYDIGSKTIQATTEYKRYSYTFRPRASNMEMKQAMLAFYGTYDSGRIPFVKNVKFELGNKVTIDTPSPKEDYENAYPSYTGTYSDFNVEGSDNPKDYAWVRSMGSDGTPAKLLSLQADSYVMKFDTNGNIISGQTISLSAIVQNMSGTTTWLATPYIGTAAQPPLTLAGSGNTRTISGSQWGKTVTKVVVKVTLGDFEDTIIINKLQDGAKGQDGADGRDGVAGKDGVGLKSTAITYAGSANGTTPPSTGWQTQVPTVPAGQFLWTRTIWTYTDNSNETGYSVAKMGQDGARGNDGIAGKDGVGIKATKIEYAVNTSGTVRPTTGWSTTIPNTPQGQYLWTRTTWTYTDDTTEQGYSVARQGNNGQNGADGVAGKDGVGLRSTSVTYAGSANGTTPPSTGWNTQVPTVAAGQYLWTKTVWTYTDSSSETGYSVARMGQNGNNGKDGIAGKDGVGIKTTVIEYAVNTSGTTRPTSGWSSSIPTVPQGQYLWTRTTWTYTDNTTEQGFTVARQGSNGANGTNGANAISAFLSNETVSLPANAAGVVSSFATARGTMMVYEGLNRVTSGVTFSLGAHNNTTASVDASGNFAVTAMTADSATVVINATYKGQTLSKTFSLSKAKQGVQGVQGTMGIAFYSPTEPTGATVTNGATWFKTKSASDDTVIGIYTRKSGAWKQTPLASGTLAVEQLSAISANIGNVTAGNLTGVKITGASFVNPFDFTDQTNNHIQGTTEISNSELDISGTANAGTAGERKFHTTVAPLYFEATYSDAADNLIRSLNMSSSGFILNEVGNRVTTSLSSGQFQALDSANGKSVITSTNNISITNAKNTASMSPSGFLYNNRKNIQIWTGKGEQINNAANNSRLRFGKYYNVGWGMTPEDVPFKQIYPYLWQVTRDIRFAVIIQVMIQDATSPWIYYDLHYGPDRATDTKPRTTTPLGQIGPTMDSGDKRISYKNSIECIGYVGLKANEYFSLNSKCTGGKHCGNQTVMSAWFREIWEEGAFY